MLRMLTVAIRKYDKVEFAVHRLLGEYFIHNPDPTTKIFIDHKNGKKADNRLRNLHWVTHAENMYNTKFLHSFKQHDEYYAFRCVFVCLSTFVVF